MPANSAASWVRSRFRPGREPFTCSGGLSPRLSAEPLKQGQLRCSAQETLGRHLGAPPAPEKAVVPDVGLHGKIPRSPCAVPSEQYAKDAAGASRRFCGENQPPTLLQFPTQCIVEPPFCQYCAFLQKKGTLQKARRGHHKRAATHSRCTPPAPASLTVTPPMLENPAERKVKPPDSHWLRQYCSCFAVEDASKHFLFNGRFLLFV